MRATAARNNLKPVTQAPYLNITLAKAVKQGHLGEN